MFQFKQFSVDQTGCAMKINTDGVLLGALAEAEDPSSIMDIGTGTGVIALMMAQRFKDAKIDAVEIDATAAHTAGRNFANSTFTDRLCIFPIGMESFFERHPDKKYDLIVSNPPFYTRSLASPEAGRQLAKHADSEFFQRLIDLVAGQLTEDGVCWLILPLDTVSLVLELLLTRSLFLNKAINIQSYPESEPHRQILTISRREAKSPDDHFVIYASQKIYSEQYTGALKDFFIIFT